MPFKDKEKRKQINKDWYERTRDIRLVKAKAYAKTPAGKKARREWNAKRYARDIKPKTEARKKKKEKLLFQTQRAIHARETYRKKKYQIARVIRKALHGRRVWYISYCIKAWEHVRYQTGRKLDGSTTRPPNVTPRSSFLSHMGSTKSC